MFMNTLQIYGYWRAQGYHFQQTRIILMAGAHLQVDDCEFQDSQIYAVSGGSIGVNNSYFEDCKDRGPVIVAVGCDLGIIDGKFNTHQGIKTTDCFGLICRSQFKMRDGTGVAMLCIHRRRLKLQVRSVQIEGGSCGIHLEDRSGPSTCDRFICELVTFKGIQGPAMFATGNGSPVIDRCRIENCRASSLEFHGLHAEIKGVKIDGGYYGVALHDCAVANITQCEINRTEAAPIYTDETCTCNVDNSLIDVSNDHVCEMDGCVTMCRNLFLTNALVPPSEKGLCLNESRDTIEEAYGIPNCDWESPRKPMYANIFTSINGNVIENNMFLADGMVKPIFMRTCHGKYLVDDTNEAIIHGTVENIVIGLDLHLSLVHCNGQTVVSESPFEQKAETGDNIGQQEEDGYDMNGNICLDRDVYDTDWDL